MINYKFYSFELNCYGLIHLIKNLTGISDLDDDVVKSITSLNLNECENAKITHGIAEQLSLKVQNDNSVLKVQLKNDDFNYKYRIHIKAPLDMDKNIIINSVLNDIFVNYSEILRDLKRYFNKIKKQSDELDKIINSLGISV